MSDGVNFNISFFNFLFSSSLVISYTDFVTYSKKRRITLEFLLYNILVIPHKEHGKWKIR